MKPAERVIGYLEPLRHAEKEQALAYREFAARAEELGDPELAQRFHDLHADEQHHLSRLTARVLELGGRPANVPNSIRVTGSLEDWEGIIREREGAEIARYDAIPTAELDEETRALLEAIVAVERHHASELGGKWTLA